jgi:hypothetical protein
MFICLGTLTLLRPNVYFMAPLQEKVVFGMFFLGAVLCLSFSWLFHTVYCHSEKVSRTFSKYVSQLPVFLRGFACFLHSSVCFYKALCDFTQLSGF